MNKSAIKNYAVWARNELIARVSQKAYEYGVTEKETPKYDSELVNGKLLSNTEKKQLNELISQVNKHGFNHVMEEVAYTWFNRFIALRFMEVNNYLPQKINVFTDGNNKFKPQILSEAIHVELDGVDKQKVFDYIEENKQEELYKYLLLTLCNDMNQYLPDMFTSIKDYKTLLFPDNLLKEDSVLAKLITDIDEDSWTDQVQIIGWLYQYYIQMPKDELIHAKKQYRNDDIPFVTQLFTPDWIVRYLVENTLGNYYVRKNPNTDLINDWKYFIKNNSTGNNLKKIEDIKFIDPCMGSGHILVYAFDLLMSFYQENGYAPRDAAELILKKNLYGFDIDERAYQLAYFSLMMKARQYNRRILSSKIKPNIYCIRNTKIESDLYDYLISKNAEIETTLINFRSIFDDANTYGSLLNVATLNNEEIENLESELTDVINNSNANLEEMLFQLDIKDHLLPSLRIARLLQSKYDFVVTNPPYLSSSLMPNELKNFVQSNYKDAKSDLFAVFIKKCIELSNASGYIGMLTPYVWMFISSYESLRHYVLQNTNISGLIQLEYNAFEAACVPVATFIMHNTDEKYKGNYIKLSDFKGAENQAPKTIEAIQNHNCGFYYETSTENFSKIPGNPIAYWVSSKLLSAFQDGRPLSAVCRPMQGLATADNGRFLRLWYEVCNHNISFDCTSTEDSLARATRWFPFNKGGDFRRWYGNRDYVVNWENDGYEIKHFVDEKGKVRSRPQNTLFYFRQSVTCSAITSSTVTYRFYPKGAIFDVNMRSYFIADEEKEMYVLGFLNSKVVNVIASIISPSLALNAYDMNRFPFIYNQKQSNCVAVKTKELINISKKDWDSFETSWDFKGHPLVKNHVSTISEAYSLWNSECESRFNTLKSNEEELNRIFIDIFGLQDELDSYVEDKDVTVRKADLVRDIKSFISYAVGCMFGRYSLDVEGLAYAGGEWDDSKYKSFIPDQDDIIPIYEDEFYGDDDITGRFIDFVRVAFGEDDLEANLIFIADSLGGRGTPRKVIRDYFINDFFKDHCQMYQVTGSGKRPIYWQFDSGKKNGFKALVYIHRYKPDLIARMRTEYVHPQQARYRTQINMLENQIGSVSKSDEIRIKKEIQTIKAKADELAIYEEKIHHWADKMEPMDLDDGVKANYAKFQELLTKIK